MLWRLLVSGRIDNKYFNWPPPPLIGFYFGICASIHIWSRDSVSPTLHALIYTISHQHMLQGPVYDIWNTGFYVERPVTKLNQSNSIYTDVYPTFMHIGSLNIGENCFINMFYDLLNGDGCVPPISHQEAPVVWLVINQSLCTWQEIYNNVGKQKILLAVLALFVYWYLCK